MTTILSNFLKNKGCLNKSNIPPSQSIGNFIFDTYQPNKSLRTQNNIINNVNASLGDRGSPKRSRIFFGAFSFIQIVIQTC